MKWLSALAALFFLPPYCVHPPSEHPLEEDRSIAVPPFDATTRIDLEIDGATLQAVRVAANDFVPPSPEARPCAQTQAAYRYRVSHDGELVFVEISRDPAACGGQGRVLDGAGRYAVSRDGRILRRVLDGDGENTVPDDAGTLRSVYPVPDGGTPFNDSSVRIDYDYTPPWMFDGGAGSLQPTSEPP